jgi:antibiotic biosynthesis monooxygenase (ABM) superfamily enzyme
MVARFSSSEHAAAFDASAARKEMLARAERLGFEERVRRIDRQGHVSWFHLDTDDPDTGAPAITTAAADEEGGAQ